MIMAVTGHRPEKIGGYSVPNPTYRSISLQLDSWLSRLKPQLGITGMALGWDQLAAELFLDHDIPFVAAVPFAGQESRWRPEQQRRYHTLLEKSHKVQIVSGGGYAAWKMQRRNEWMVEQLTTKDDYLVACWDGTDGGTKNCVDFARKRREDMGFDAFTIVNVDPRAKYPLADGKTNC